MSDNKELIISNGTELDASLYGGTTDDFGKGDLAYSWLRIAQSNTEQVKKLSQSKIEGLEEGMFFDSLTSKPLGTKAKVIFLKFFHSFREMTPGQDGEYVRAISSDEFQHLQDIKDVEWVEKLGWSLQNGNVVKESWNYMILLPEHRDLGPVRLAFGAGSKKHCNAWNSQIKMARLPGGQSAAPFSIIWELELGMETNANKKTYYTIGSGGRTLVKKLGFIADPSLLAEAKDAWQFFQEKSGVEVEEAGMKSASTDEAL